MLNKDTLNRLWQSGYCKTLIEQLRHTQEGTAGSAKRLELMQVHLATGCVNCKHANTIREVEHRTALAMGEEAVQVFNRGGDIRQLPRFAEVFQAVFKGGLAVGKIDNDVMAWLTRTVPLRAGQSYPHAEEPDGSQAN